LSCAIAYSLQFVTTDDNQWLHRRALRFMCDWWRSLASEIALTLKRNERKERRHRKHARRSLSTVGGDTQWPINHTPLLSFSHSPSSSPPPERCKVSQQVLNRVMNWTWTCISPYC